MAAAFLTIPEVARLLRVGERTAYSLARAGELAGAVRVGNQWRVSRSALDRWAEVGPHEQPRVRGTTTEKRRRGRA